MAKSLAARGCVVALAVVALAVPVSVAAQSASRASSASSSPPRTPWGDPDIQGNYTNLWEVGTPFERPEQFAGRRIEDVTRDELLKMRLAIQQQTRDEQLAGDIGGTRWIWLDSHNHAKGSVAVRVPAQTLLLLIWNRIATDDPSVNLFGDDSVLQRFLGLLP